MSNSKKVIVCFSALDMSAAIRLQSALQAFSTKLSGGGTEDMARELRQAMQAAGTEILDTSIVADKGSR